MSEPQGFDGSGNTRRLPVLEKTDDADDKAIGTTGPGQSSSVHDPLPTLGDADNAPVAAASGRRAGSPRPSSRCCSSSARARSSTTSPPYAPTARR